MMIVDKGTKDRRLEDVDEDLQARRRGDMVACDDERVNEIVLSCLMESFASRPEAQ